MKITIDEKPAAPRIEYPCLMIACDGTLVLFRKAGVGAVIKSPAVKICSFSSVWDMDLFTPFTGSVTLSND